MTVRHWTNQEMPACWDDPGEWAGWARDRQGAAAPCVDCSPAYKQEMMREGRCARHETAFFRTKNGEVYGISADTDTFSQVLHGGVPAGTTPLSEPITRTEEWKERLTRAIEWAPKRGGREIRAWLKDE